VDGSPGDYVTYTIVAAGSSNAWTLPSLVQIYAPTIHAVGTSAATAAPIGAVAAFRGRLTVFTLPSATDADIRTYSETVRIR